MKKKRKILRLYRASINDKDNIVSFSLYFNYITLIVSLTKEYVDKTCLLNSGTTCKILFYWLG